MSSPMILVFVTRDEWERVAARSEANSRHLSYRHFCMEALRKGVCQDSSLSASHAQRSGEMNGKSPRESGISDF